MPSKIDKTFIGAWEWISFDRMHLLPATNDSFGYQRELNPGLLGTSPSQLNHSTTAAAAADCTYLRVLLVMAAGGMLSLVPSYSGCSAATVSAGNGHVSGTFQPARSFPPSAGSPVAPALDFYAAHSAPADSIGYVPAAAAGTQLAYPAAGFAVTDRHYYILNNCLFAQKCTKHV